MLENLRPIPKLPQGVRFTKPLRFTLLEQHAALLEQLPKKKRDALMAQALETFNTEQDMNTPLSTVPNAYTGIRSRTLKR